MSILDNLTHGVKEFFVESDGKTTPAPASTVTPTPAVIPSPQPIQVMPVGTYPGSAIVPEQRHVDHINQLLNGDSKDFYAFIKMVRSLSVSGFSGLPLYQTAFNAFTAVTSVDLLTLVSSGEATLQKLADDHVHVEERHHEKMGEAVADKPASGPVANLQTEITQLQSQLAALTKELTEKSQLLTEKQQQLQQETSKAQASFASYEQANSLATNEIQVHLNQVKSLLLK